jgi:hypothetical protein
MPFSLRALFALFVLFVLFESEPLSFCRARTAAAL